MSAKWSEAAKADAGRAIYAGAEAVDPQERREVTDAVLETLLPHVEIMCEDHYQSGIEHGVEAAADEAYCEEVHLDREASDLLSRAAEDDHYVNHEGPWPTCPTSLCRAVREVLHP